MAKMYWWKGVDLKPFLDRVVTVGLENVRVEFSIEDGLLRVVDNRAALKGVEGDEGGFDFVHVCPPDCPT